MTAIREGCRSLAESSVDLFLPRMTWEGAKNYEMVGEFQGVIRPRFPKTPSRFLVGILVDAGLRRIAVIALTALD